jgi:effector-binding domain-containing protein
MDAPSISIIECAPRLFAYTRRQAVLKNMPAVAAASPVWRTVFERGLKSLETPLAVFVDAAGETLFGDEGFLVDLGMEVLEPFEGDLTLQLGTTPAGRAAAATFNGPYEARIETVHRAIRAWCRDHSHAVAGPIWEVYSWNEDPTLQEITVHYLLD